MSTGRLITETATPEEVAVVNALLVIVRMHWRLACAWEHVDPITYGGGFGPENPYAAEYEAAVARYEGYRRAQ